MIYNALTTLKVEVWRPVLEKNITVFLEGQDEIKAGSGLKNFYNFKYNIFTSSGLSKAAEE